jgi:hypothetical protein
MMSRTSLWATPTAGAEEKLAKLVINTALRDMYGVVGCARNAVDLLSFDGGSGVALVAMDASCVPRAASRLSKGGVCVRASVRARAGPLTLCVPHLRRSGGTMGASSGSSAHVSPLCWLGSPGMNDDGTGDAREEWHPRKRSVGPVGFWWN